MAEKSGFFSSRGGDRTYTADFFADYFAGILTNGIYNGGTNLKVINSSNDMESDVQAGRAFINGYFYHNSGTISLTHKTAHATLNRIDRVILRLDISEDVRSISLHILAGTPNQTPAPPALTRNDTVHEISLARVLIEAGSSVIAVGNITDERLDSSVCGLINSLIHVDTAEFERKFDEWFEEQQTEGFLMANNLNKSGEFGVAGYDYVKSELTNTNTQIKNLDFIPMSQKGVSNGIATLDADGNINELTFQPGNIIIYYYDSYSSTDHTSWSICNKCTCGVSGNIRISFKIRAQYGTTQARLIIGTVYKSIRTTSSGSYITFTEDCHVNKGDTIQLLYRLSSKSGTPPYAYAGYLKIAVDRAPVISTYY
jgi:hypothetical protein